MFVVNDYRGQKPSQLTSEVTKQIKQKGWFVPDKINSLVFVVDLFNWKEKGDETKTYKKIDDSRVDEQLLVWQPNSVELVTGLTDSSSLKGIYLFINKVDQYISGKPFIDVEKEAIAKYGVMVTTLNEIAKSSNVEFRCFVGSARAGTSVIGKESLVGSLLDHSQDVV